MQAGLPFLLYKEGYAGVVFEFEDFVTTRLGLNSQHHGGLLPALVRRVRGQREPPAWPSRSASTCGGALQALAGLCRSLVAERDVLGPDGRRTSTVRALVEKSRDSTQRVRIFAPVLRTLKLAAQGLHVRSDGPAGLLRGICCRLILHIPSSSLK